MTFLSPVRAFFCFALVLGATAERAEAEVLLQVGPGTGGVAGFVRGAGTEGPAPSAWIEVVALSAVRDRRFPEPWVPDLPAERTIATLTTGEDGRFRILGLPAGRYRVRLGDAGPQDASADIWVDDGQVSEPLELSLTVGRALRGRVVARDGAPIVGVPVFVSAHEGEDGGNTLLGDPGESTLTGEHGAFLLPRLPSGTLWLNAGRRSFGYATPVRVQLVDGSVPDEIELVVDDEREQLVVPEARLGGLGLSIAWDGRGPLLDGTVGSMPATRAGLRAGDRILAIDGRSTRFMTRRELVARCRGLLGTVAMLDVEREGRTFSLPLVREPYPR